MSVCLYVNVSVSECQCVNPYSPARGLLPDLHEFIDLLTAPATKILDRWFESEPLRATLATDAVIGKR